MKIRTIKKSRHVASVLRGAGVLVLMLPVAACDQNERTVGQEDVKVYQSVEACAAESDPTTCTAAHDQALAEHREQAPRYTSAEQCRDSWRSCEEVRSSTGSFFMPALVGFMMGRMLTGSAQPQNCDPNRDPNCRRGGGYGGYGGYARSSRPVYYDRDGYASTTDRRLGIPNTGAPGRTMTVRAPVTAGGEIGTRSAVVSRGGFGGSSAKFGSSGS